MKTNARAAALEALEKCRRDGAWSGAVIDSLIKGGVSDRKEASFATCLILGVLQNESLCDFYIDSYLNAKKIEPKVRDILRLGAYQLLFLDRIPARAAVNESVALCALCGVKRAAGLVNAVLRRIADNRDALPEIPGKGTAEHLSIKYSHPEWLVRRLIEEQGYALTEDFLRANNEKPALTIQINTLKVRVEDYLRALDRQEREYRLFDGISGCVELESCNVTELPGFEEGLFYIQDAAARMAADISGVRPGMCVLDACSAPGGKSFAAAIAMENRGRIVSCDIHEKKLRLIRSGAERLGISIIEAKCSDASEPNADYVDAFDAVIADVPCSGIGVIRKKPEIRRKKEEDIRKLPELQYRILSNLASYVRPGGTLIYSTCTVLRAENEDVVRRFLDENNSFVPAEFYIGEKRADSGMYTFRQNTDGTDGFFAAKLIRKE